MQIVGTCGRLNVAVLTRHLAQRERESPQDVTEKLRAQGSSSPEEGTVCPAALTSEPTPRGGGQRASALAESGDLSPGEAAGPVLTAQTPPAEPVQPAQ